MDALEALTEGSEQIDKLLQDISRDLTAAQTRFSVLKYPSLTPSSSPLAPPTEPELENDELEDNDFDDYISSSSSSEEDDSELAARAKEPKAKQPLAQMRLLCRRAAFKRLEMLAQAEHHTKAEKRYSGDSSTSQSHSILSPKITLSTEPSRTSTPTETPQLSLSAPGASDDDTESITLLPSRPIPSGSFLQSGSNLAGALLTPDTHGETICRLLYVFTQANPQWAYHQGLVDIVCHLYSTYVQIEWVSRQRKGKGGRTREPVARGKWAEEQTYWALCGLVREYEAIIIPSPSPLPTPSAPESTLAPKSELNAALDCLSRRLKYADAPLWGILHDNALDPVQQTYASRWISLLITRDLPLSYLAPVWDYILASGSGKDDRVDAVVDICVAIIVLCRQALLGDYARIRTTPSPTRPSQRQNQKQKGMWGEIDLDDEAMSATYDARKQLDILRAVPLDRICPPASVLHIAHQLAKDRANVSGLGLWDETPSGQAGGLWNSWAQVQSYADPKTVAKVSETSARWTSAAVAGLSGASKKVSEWSSGVKANAAQSVPSVPAPAPAARSVSSGSATSAPSIGGLWSSLRSWAPTSITSNLSANPTASPPIPANMKTPPQDEYESFTPLSLTPDRRGSFEGHSKPRLRGLGMGMEVDEKGEGGRERSDSVASGYSIASLQERLAGLSSATRTPPNPARTQSPLGTGTHGGAGGSGGSGKGIQGPRPLLLGKSSHRISSQSYGDSPREREGRRDSGSSSTYSYLASPPSISQGPSSAQGQGLYRIGSRQGAATRTKPVEGEARP